MDFSNKGNDVFDNGDRAVMVEIDSLGHAEGEAGDDGGDESAQVVLPHGFEESELKGILEALLFVSQDPLSLDRFTSVLGGVSKEEVKRAIRVLEKDLEQPGRPLQLVEVAGGYRLVTRAEYSPWIKRLEKAKPAQKLSRSALEALAIIAYKQPIVRGEIEGIRGVETSGVLRTLLERKLIRMVGRKEVPGRPIMYGTTKFFLEHFGLRDLSGLPPLKEFTELGESEQVPLPVGEELLSGEEPLEEAMETEITSELVETMDSLPPPEGEELPPDS